MELQNSFCEDIVHVPQNTWYELQIVAMIHDCQSFPVCTIKFIMILVLGEFEAHVCLVLV